MKLLLRRLLIFLVVLTMVIPAGLAYAATDDGTAEQTEEAVTEASPEEGEGLSDLEEIDPATLNVHKLGEDLDLDALDKTADKAKKSGVIDPEEIAKMDEEELNKTVRVSIFMEDSPVLERYSIAQAKGTAAKSYRSTLEKKQLNVEKSINIAIGRKLDTKWHLTLAVNAISTEATYAEIAKIYKVKGVKRVELEKRYVAMEDVNTAEPNTSITSEGMTGASSAWAQGYTGAGRRIAIIDTGIDTTHQSFDADAFDHAIAELTEKGKTVDLMTEADIPEGLNGKGVYFSSKLPYVYNYVDGNTDVTHINDTEGEHGSHVAGIAAANRYIEKEDGSFANAATEVYAVGMAPDAQIIVMKVFGQAGGAYDSDYMSAIEDAILLGCDSCNLSLGSSDPGFTYDTTYQEVLNKLSLDNDGMVVTISAGNSGSWADYNAPLGELFLEDVNMDTLGSPASFINSLSVASAENLGTTGKPLEFNGADLVYYTDGAGDMSSIANEGGYDYVYIDTVGYADDYAAVNEAVSLKGKIVIVNRGSLTFVQKGNNAIAFEPAAVIIANNQPGTIGMSLDGMTGTFPMVSITQDDAGTVKTGSSASATIEGVEITPYDDEGETVSPDPHDVTYYTGTVKVSKDVSVNITNTLEDTEISDFSSWGIAGSLLMKPEVTAPGGNIYSVAGTNTTKAGTTAGGPDKYELMSGTSMAAPHAAGLSAILLQYLEETGVENLNKELAKSYTNRAIAQSLLMSTAVPMQPYAEEGYEGYLPIIQQGAGLIDVSKAMNAGSVVMMNEAGLTTATGAAADGKVKVELGEDPGKTGEYAYSFTIYNTTDVDEEFELDTEMFTQDIDDVYAEDGIYFMSPYTRDIAADVSYTWQSYMKIDKYDVDKDGDTDKSDAQAVLDYLTGENDGSGLDLKAGDIDEDGELTSKDAQLILNWTPEDYESSYVIPAKGKAEVTVYISITDDLTAYPNGAYIEGYTYANCITKTDEGVKLDHSQSIPILGFYGNWSDPSMFDALSYYDKEEMEYYGYSEEDIQKITGTYAYTGNIETNFMTVKYDGKTLPFLGNPYTIEEEGFPYDRLAVSSGTEIKNFYYNLIRPTGTIGYAVSTVGEEPEVLASKIDSYNLPGIWYYDVDQTWMDANTRSVAVNSTIKNYKLQEGDKLRVGLYAVPEYYAMLLNEAYDGDMLQPWSGILYYDEDLGTMATLGLLGEGASIDYDLTIDDTVPVIDKESIELDKEAGTVKVKASDNLNIAYLAVMSVDGETVYAEEVPAGPEAEVTMDIAEAITEAEGYVAIFAGDYAGNETAVALRVNDAEAEDPTIVSEVITSPERINLFKGGTADMGFKVLPITAEDKTVTWTTGNEEIAAVTEDGTVTGLAEGETTVRATSNSALPEGQTEPVYGESKVKVLYVEKDLNGLLWDEEGKQYFMDFNTGKLPEYNKGVECGAENLVSAFDYYGTIYSGSLDTSAATSSIYKVDPANSYALEKLGDLPQGVWASDIAAGYDDMGLVAYTYRNYLLYADPNPDQQTGNCGEYYAIGSFGTDWLAGVAYAGGVEKEAPAFGEGTFNFPSYYFLDETGKIWYTEVGTDEEGYFIFTDPELVIDTGIATNFLYQDLYFDGTYIYWSHYDDGDYSELYIIDLEKDPETGAVTPVLYKAGDFGAKVWPVSGFYEMPEPSEEEEPVTPDPELETNYKALANVPDFSDEEAEARFYEAVKNFEAKNGNAYEEPSGTLNAVRSSSVKREAELPEVMLVQEDQTEVSEIPDINGPEITISESVDSSNGLVTVTFDPSKIKAAGAASGLVHRSIHIDNEAGTVNFAYANEEPITAETVLATIKFENPVSGKADIKAATKERNEELGLSEEEEYTFGKPGWVKDDGDWYYFDENGGMVTDAWRKDSKGWCYLGSDGKMVTNDWAKDSKGWCWIGSDGYMVEKTQWLKVDGAWYHITNGYRDENKWMKDSKGWCYLGSDGKMVTNDWAKDSRGYCWIGSEGYMVEKTQWLNVDGTWYHISNGYMDVNTWMKDSKGWCYLGSDGKMLTNGWAKDSKGWCWIGSDGYMPVSTKWVEYEGDWYYISSGYRVDNAWRKDSKGWCYLGADGKMLKNDWARDSKGTCWMGPDGYMLIETRLIEYMGDTYGIEDGYMVTGRSIVIDGTEYIFDPDGKLAD